MFVQPRGACLVPEGDCLGELKRELPGRRIVEFGAAGPKNYYVYHVDRVTGGDPQAVIKCRGITLHYKAAQLLTYQRVKQMIFEYFNLTGGLYVFFL